MIFYIKFNRAKDIVHYLNVSFMFHAVNMVTIRIHFYSKSLILFSISLIRSIKLSSLEDTMGIDSELVATLPLKSIADIGRELSPICNPFI